MTSKSAALASSGTQAPKPEVLAGLTDQHFLTVLGTSPEPLSRAEVAARSGLSKPAVSAAALRLLDRGLVNEVGQRQGRRGGVATLLEINAARGHSLAVAVQPQRVQARARDLLGRVVFEETVPLPAVVEPTVVAPLTDALVGRARVTVGTPLLTAAVSMADPVDWPNGDPVPLPETAFPGGRFSPRRDLDLRAEGPVVVDNDVNWASLAEHQAGVMAGCPDFVYVYCGSGLGAGLVLGGRLYRGRRGLAGEIGYLREQGGADLTRTLGRLGFGRPDRYELDLDAASALLSAAALSDDTRTAIHTFARHLANLVILVNPSAVVLAGPLSDHPAFVDGVAEQVLALSLDPPELVVSTFRPLAGASHEAHERARTEVGFPARTW